MFFTEKYGRKVGSVRESSPYSDERKFQDFLEVAIVFFLSAAFYVSLYAELPYHDVARFADQVNSGHYVWDIAHIFLQPATLVWHQYLGFGESAVSSQKHINTCATALAIAIFYALLLWLRLPCWQRIAASLLLLASCSVITLAPTGHMKLLAFPFVNAALYALVVWEHGGIGNKGLILGAILLSVAASFLASALATAPFATFAVLAISLRAGRGWKAALVHSVGFTTICGLIFAVLAVFGFLTFSGQPFSAQGLAASVAAKDSLRVGYFSIADNIGRAGFGTINNMIAAPDIGSVMRAWIGGYIPSLTPYSDILIREFLPWFATLVLIGVIYVGAIVAATHATACLIPLAFLAGAQAWAAFYNLNDPEHWFQLSAPTILLFLMIFRQSAIAVILPTWTLVTVAVNTLTIAIPQALYPLDAYQSQLRGLYSSQDLLIDFAAYPGRQYLGVFDLPSVPCLSLDIVFSKNIDETLFFATVGSEIDETLARGGKVVIFGVLDPYDWDAPWGMLTSRKMTKDKLFGFFQQNYRVVSIGKIAEIDAWQIEPIAPH